MSSNGLNQVTSATTPATRERENQFAVGSWRFSIPSRNALQAFCQPGRRYAAWCSVLHALLDGGVTVLGPVLICVASAIIALLAYSYFWILLPMLQQYHADAWYCSIVLVLHTLFVIFLLTNVIVNYALCVTTSNLEKNPSYAKVIRELAESTNFVYPENPEAVERFRKDFEDRMVLRYQARRARAEKANMAANAQVASATGSNVTQRKNAAGNGSTTPTAPDPGGPPSAPPTPPRGWMIMGAHEWCYDPRTKQPKPPRSHYCHISKGLVLCLDHYCPWMFNSVGYFNYRYFVNFLLYVSLSMMYAVYLTYRPFLHLTSHKFKMQFHTTSNYSMSNPAPPMTRLDPLLPYHYEKMYISLSFMLSLAVGIAVIMLCIFHLYLTFSSQTTIEFHGNFQQMQSALRTGKRWKNPYSMGTKRNFQQIYGTLHPLLALLPSNREPEFLPVPISGDRGKRAFARSSKQPMGASIV